MKKTKLLALGISAFLAFAINAFAIPKDPCAPKDACCEEPAPGPFAFYYPKDVGLACPRDFFVHGEFLWMKGYEDGLDFAMDQDATTPQTFPLQNGKVYGFSSGSNEWDYRPGFRVGFGFYGMQDFWSLSADWTYIRIKSTAEAKNEGTGTLLNLWYGPLLNSLDIPHMSAKWSGDYSTLDLMLSKPYHVSRYFISNPKIGIRAAWIDQDYLLRVFQESRFKRIVHFKNDFWGVGLRSAYDTEFLLGSGWSLYANAGIALMFGKFDISQNSDNPTIINVRRRAEYDLTDSFYAVKPSADIAFGINWSNFYEKNQYLISLKVGYEFHYFKDQNQARRFFDLDAVSNEVVSKGSLSFNGFMFGLKCEF